MSETIELSGRTAVITGGASGIGLACARRLAAAGATVAVADKNMAAAEAAARSLSGCGFGLDVGDEASVERLGAEIHARWGAVDILINSAGVLQRTLPPDQLSLKEWDFVARVDLRGTYLCCAVFGREMARRGSGCILNIASVAGMGAGPLHSYGPAKAGVINLTQGLAGEWGPAGVRVNCISPGFTRTPALDKGFSTQTLAEEQLEASSALGRLVAADEIAGAALFLCSPLASAVTGVNLPVDAGYLVASPWAAYGGLRKTRADGGS